ncbi:MAG: hypothetical protein JSS89_12110 [Bacteroidetes bacterium]|nr:hypothetical protein [Bacteroidota bacterium]
MPATSTSSANRHHVPVVAASQSRKKAIPPTSDETHHTPPAPIKTRRRCIVYILESLAGDKPLSMDDMQRTLVRSSSQVRRLLTTIRRLYMVRIVLRKGRYHLDARYNPDEILSVAYKILRGNDNSVCEAMFLINMSRLKITEESLIGLRHAANN